MLNRGKFCLIRVVQRCYISTSECSKNRSQGVIQGDNIESSLWFTTLPHKRKNNLLMKTKKPKFIPKFIPKGPPLISCKLEQLNHYSGQTYEKFKAIPLVSKGWYHYKSKGDFFTVHPTTDHPAFLMSKSDLSKFAATFDEAGVEPWLQESLRRQGILAPTTIQGKSIPIILGGKNALLVAETGCGKTLAYLLPMIQRVLKWKNIIGSDRKFNSPLGIIIVPNRELALQVGEVVKTICEGSDVFCQTIIGGHVKQLLLNPELQHVDIVISTLGAFSKLTTHRQYRLRDCKHLVLDEADTLMDDTFNEKMVHFTKRFPILFSGPETADKLPLGTQVTFASATMPTSLNEIIGQVIAIESLERISTKYLHRVLPHVPQTFLRVGKAGRAEELLRLVNMSLSSKQPTMIFSNRTSTCDWVSFFLNENGVSCERLNGNMEVDQRMGRYKRFVHGEVDVISCTDVTSRGIDCTRVKHVINFDFPLYMADYIHRCGRTGRIGHDKNCQITNIISSRREIELVQQIETAARTFTELHNVNNNIRRIIEFRGEKARKMSLAHSEEKGVDDDKEGDVPKTDNSGGTSVRPAMKR